MTLFELCKMVKDDVRVKVEGEGEFFEELPYFSAEDIKNKDRWVMERLGGDILEMEVKSFYTKVVKTIVADYDFAPLIVEVQETEKRK